MTSIDYKEKSPSGDLGADEMMFLVCNSICQVYLKNNISICKW
jgi:hypothetical protein